MKVLWICGLPNEVRLRGTNRCLSFVPTPAWSWILGHLPPPNGVVLHILCPVLGLKEKECHFEHLGVHWHCFRQKRFEQAFLWFRMFLTIRSFVKSLNPDVIHGWGGETGCGWISTLLSRYAVVSVQGILPMLQNLQHKKSGLSDRIRFLVERLSYLRARVRLVESETSREGLVRYYKVNSQVVPHPLRAAFVQSDAFGMKDKSCLQVLYVGQLVPRKGTMDVLTAFVRIKAKVDRLLALTMVGDGGLLCSAREYVQSAGLSDSVVFKDRCSAEEVCALMQKAHVFCLPSFGDTGPTALKEAIAQGCVPVCYNNSGPRELISHYGGYLARTGDVDELTEKLQLALDESSTSEERAIESSLRIKHDLSKEFVWGRLKEIYRFVKNEV